MLDGIIGQTMWRISGSGIVRYFTPVKVEKVTPAQITARAPNGQTARYWRKNGYEVGSDHMAYLITKQPEESRTMQLSAMAKERRS